jgi:hypothetical protein
MLEMARVLQNAGDLVGTEHRRQRQGTLGALNLLINPTLFEDPHGEEAKSGPVYLEGGPTQLPLAEQIQQVGAHLLGVQLFRTLAVIAGKPLDTAEIGSNGLFGGVAELQFLPHSL